MIGVAWGDATTDARCSDCSPTMTAPRGRLPLGDNPTLAGHADRMARGMARTCVNV
jgi:hypothetical protein